MKKYVFLTVAVIAVLTSLSFAQQNRPKGPVGKNLQRWIEHSQPQQKTERISYTRFKGAFSKNFYNRKKSQVPAVHSGKNNIDPAGPFAKNFFFRKNAARRSEMMSNTHPSPNGPIVKRHLHWVK